MHHCFYFNQNDCRKCISTSLLEISRGIFHKIMEEIDAEGIALYHHQRKFVPTRARSNFVPMFA
jgi:hypothetical protein